MNVTAPSSILPSPSAGDGTIAPEGGEALPETGFAAHLLAQTVGEKPRALPKASTGAAIAQDEVENASAEPRLTDPSLPLEQGRLPTSEDSGRTLPPGLAARLQNAGSSALVATPQAPEGRAPSGDLAAGGSKVAISAVSIDPRELAQPGSGEALLKPRVDATVLGAKDMAGQALQLSKSQSGSGAEQIGAPDDPEFAHAQPGAVHREFGLSADALPLKPKDTPSAVQTLALPADNLSRARASTVAPGQQTKAAAAEDRRSFTPRTLTPPELTDAASDERVARSSEHSAQGPVSAPGLPASAANTPATLVNANPVASPVSASVANAVQTNAQSSQNNPAALDQVVEQIVEAREAGRSVRPELSVRTSDFGTVAMRIEASSTDWRATLSARDPGFVPAVQAALAERTVAATSESGLSQHNSSQRGDSQSHSGSQSSGGFGAAHGGSEQRYGSSTGSAQGSVQPYSGEEGLGGTETTATDQDVTRSSASKQAADGARFA